MKTLKRITILLICLLIVVSPLLGTFNNYFSFADEEQEDGWAITTTKGEISAAAKAYYASRNFFIRINPTKAILEWDYNTLNEACLALYNKTAIECSNDIKYMYDNNWGLRFLFADSAVTRFNSIYHYLLQKYGILENQTKNLYSGELFTDDDGISCFVTVFNYKQARTRTSESNFLQDIHSLGTYYWKTGIDIWEMYSSVSGTENVTTRALHLKNDTYYYKIFTMYDNSIPAARNYCTIQNDDSASSKTSKSIYWQYYDANYSYNYYDGFPMIAKIRSTGKYYLGNFLIQKDPSNTTKYYSYEETIELTPDSSEVIDAAVSVAQKGLTDGGYAAGKAALIDTGRKGANALDDFLEDDEPDVTVTPVDDPNNLPNPPSGDTNINSNIGIVIGGNGINFNLPDLSNIGQSPQNLPNNFSLPVLKTKFPFCLVYDIPALLSLFEDEPVAPRFQGDISLPLNMTYHLDINLSMFDNVMVIFRNLLFVLYVFSLVFITKELLF